MVCICMLLVVCCDLDRCMECDQSRVDGGTTFIDVITRFRGRHARVVIFVSYNDSI
jgi:hypothetical protein